MDVFRVHERLLGDYSRFTRSFVEVADKRIADTDVPSHDTTEQQATDAAIDECLQDWGYTSLRFHHSLRGGWVEMPRANPSVFGPLR